MTTTDTKWEKNTVKYLKNGGYTYTIEGGEMSLHPDFIKHINAILAAQLLTVRETVEKIDELAFEQEDADKVRLYVDWDKAKALLLATLNTK